jgi:hypothetical protein
MIFAMQAVATYAQTAEEPALKFSLSIEEKQLGADYPATDHEFLVKYTNTSDTIQQDDCANRPWVYTLVILRDGLPVEKKTVDRQTDESSNPGGINVHRINIHPETLMNCGKMTRGFKPGESVKFPLWVSSEYDVTAPGTYEITVTRETDRWNPEKSVTVKSNTTTIVVPQPAVVAPQ